MPQPIPLTLAGQRYELKPDFVALSALEDYFNASLVDIADLFTGREARIMRMAETLAIILDFPPASTAMLGEEIVEAGVGTVLQTLQDFFLLALGLKDREP